MRILLVGDTYPPERAAGAVRASGLAEWARAQGHQVTVVTGNPHYPTGRIFPGYSNRLLARDEVNGVPLLRVKTLPYARESVLKRVADELKDQVRLERPPAMEGRALSMVLIPALSKTEKVAEGAQENKKQDQVEELADAKN